jgi:hypothetical protein
VTLFHKVHVFYKMKLYLKLLSFIVVVGNHTVRIRTFRTTKKRERFSRLFVGTKFEVD